MNSALAFSSVSATTPCRNSLFSRLAIQAQIVKPVSVCGFAFGAILTWFCFTALHKIFSIGVVLTAFAASTFLVFRYIEAHFLPNCHACKQCQKFLVQPTKPRCLDDIVGEDNKVIESR